MNDVGEFKNPIIVSNNQHSTIRPDRNLHEQLHRGLTGFGI
jgi:hypothetical protein